VQVLYDTAGLDVYGDGGRPAIARGRYS